MDTTTRGRLAEELRAAPPWPGPAGDAAALAELTDLMRLIALVEELNEQARQHLAPRPTVTSHLLQAREHLAGLRRTVTHATETLAYNSRQPSPLATF